MKSGTDERVFYVFSMKINQILVKTPFYWSTSSKSEDKDKRFS